MQRRIVRVSSPPPPEDRRLSSWAAYSKELRRRSNNAEILLPSRPRAFPLLARTDNTDWPSSTEEDCRYCSEHVPGTPVGIPVRFDDHTRTFLLDGMFCSIACALAFNRDRRSVDRFVVHEWILRMAREHYGIAKRKIVAAPPRFRLRKYGGDLSIEEFRTFHTRGVCCRELPGRYDRATAFYAEEPSQFGSAPPSTSAPVRRLVKRQKPIDNTRGTTIMSLLKRS